MTVMSILNIRLRRKKSVIRIAEILEKQPDFVIIRDPEGKEHELLRVDFSSSEWGEINVGKEVDVIIKESISGIKVRSVALPKVFESVEVPIPGYVVYCEICGMIKTIDLAVEGDPWRVFENIRRDHTMGSPQCDGIKLMGRFHIYDDNGVEKKDVVRLMATAEKR